jgi:putative transposase
MKLRFVAEEAAQHPVSLLCRTVGISRQAFYQAQRRGASARCLDDQRLTARVLAAFAASRETYGAPRIHAELRAQGERVGRKRIARLMRQAEIQGVSRRGRRRGTTQRDELATPAPDRLERRFAADGPDRVWVADLTYVPTRQGWLFLGLVMDLWSRRIVGWSMRDDLKADLVVDALTMALTRRQPAPGLIHHSDRGSQYTSLAYGRTLRHSGLLASMGRRGDAYDNAPAESCIATIKCELVHRTPFTTRDQARLAVFDFIECFYNPHRRHSSLGDISPNQYEKIHQPAADAA